MQIGFIGLGAMGKPMARQLLAAGHELRVYDVVLAAVEAFAAQGCQGCGSPREAADGSRVIFASLPNSKIVGQVMRGENGVFAGASEGAVVVDLSSVDPHSTRRLADEAAAKGISYLDAPVSGGVSGAEAGTLTIMVGGDDQGFRTIEPLLRTIGKKIIHVGDVGSGDAVKIVNNMLLGINMAALAEALSLGKRLGLKPETMYEIIGESSGRSYALEAKMPNFILKDNFKPGFSIDLQYKDLGLGIDTAKALGVPLPVTNLVQQVYEIARAKGYGGDDISALTRVCEGLY